MEQTRLVKVRRNIIWNFINRVVMLLLPFATRTVILYQFGDMYIGLSSLFNSVLGILSMAELGFGSAMVFSMYEPMAKGDDDAVCALLRLYRKIYTIIGSIILAVGLLMIPFLRGLINGDVPSGVNIYYLYLLNLLDTVASYFLFAYKGSILTADQRNDVTSRVTSVINIALCSCQIIIVLTAYNYYFYVALIPVFTVIRNLVINHAVNKKYPQYTCRGEVAPEKLRDIKKRVAGLFIYKICYKFRDSFDSIILSAFLGLAILGKYSNYLYIQGAITGFISVIKDSITASIGNSIVTESQEKNHSDFGSIQLIYMWLSAWCTVCLLCLYQPFIRVWAGEELLFDDGIMMVFCFYFFTYKIGDICAVYRHAIGLWWEDRHRPIVESVVNLTLNILLVRWLGVVGVMLSTIFCLIFINSIWASRILYTQYFKDYKHREYIRNNIIYTLFMLIAAAPTYLLCAAIPVEGILAIVVRALVCIVVPNVILYLEFHVLPDYKNSVKLIKSLIRSH